MSATPDYLQITKNGWYRYRRNVPADIRPQFKKPVYIACLHTRDKEQAKRLSHQESVKFDAMVARSRASLAKRSSAFLRGADIEPASRRFEALLLHSDEAARSRKLDREELAEHMALIREGSAQTQEALYANDTGDYEDDFVDFVELEGLRINPKWSHFERFAMGMLAAQARAYKALEERIAGKVVSTPTNVPVPRTEDDMDDIQQLVAKWKKSQDVTVKTGIEIDSAVRRLHEFAGVRRVSQIDEALPARFRDFLLEQGNRQGVAVGQRGKKLRVATVKKVIRLLSAAIQCAVESKAIRHNPLAGLKMPKAKDTIKGKRFEAHHLNSIFSSPVYTARYRPVGGAGEAAFWLPLMGLFAGGRETELGQLRLADIGSEDGMLYFSVDDEGDDQTIKNDESRRRIPLHPILQAIGFLRYVEWLQSKGETQLFPALRADCHGGQLGNWSKWFNRYLDETVGIDERGLNYHSFRHSLKYFGRVCSVPDATLDRLQGHQPENVGGAYGGHFPLLPLYEALATINVPGLQITHIQWTPPDGSETTVLRRKQAGRTL
ncbi:MAG: phage integrase [Herminiimonas sp.]|nr:phage integrase [Herminiimonas sp.]